MKRSMRILALLLACLTLVSVFAACGGDGGEDTTKAPAGDTTAPSGDGTDTPVTTEPKETLDVEVKDYEGYEFYVLTAGAVSYADFIIEDESTVVGQAQFQRMAILEEQYNVIISQLDMNGAGTGNSEFQKQLSSQDNIYDLGIIGGYDAASLANNGQLYALNAMEAIDLTKSWWDQNANRDLAIQGIMFFTQGDLSAANSEATFCVYYNKKLGAEALNEDQNPYTLVKEGKWTQDKFAELCMTISEDLNGDDTMTVDDRFGLYVWDDSMLGMIIGGGAKFCEVNANGEIELTLYNETTLEVFNKYIELVTNDQYAFRYQRIANVGDIIRAAWANDQALFWATSTVNTAPMREMQSDFGILPYPKLSETQDRYYSSVGPFNSQFYCFPAYLEDVDRSAEITEVLAYYGQKLIIPAVYERQLVGTYFRDDESSAMLDILLDSYVYDLGLYFQVGGYNSRVMDLLRNGVKSFDSMYKQYEKTADRAIKKINERYADALLEWKD